MKHSRSSESILTDDSSMSASGGFSKFSKWLRNAQPGGCATPPVERGVRIAPKCALKSKVCFAYEKVFENIDIDEGEVGCWQDFWLLKVDENHLRDCLDMQTETELELCQTACRSFLAKAKAVACDAAQSSVRRERALQTITAFLWGVLSKPNWSNFSVNVLNVICGVYQSQSFFKDLLETVCSAVTASHKSSFAYESIRFLEAMVCSQKNCSINTLIEIPVTCLSPTFFDTLICSVPCDPTPTPAPIHLKALNVLAILVSYERSERSETELQNYVATLKGKSLAGLHALISYAIHNFNKGFTTRSRYASFKSAGLFSSFTSSAYSYLYTPSDSGVPSAFDPQAPNYRKVPTAVCSAIVLLNELASNQTHVDALMNPPTQGDPKSYFSYITEGLQAKKWVCSPLLLDCLLCSSILFQGNRHRFTTAGGHAMLMMWNKLLFNPTFVHFLYTTSPDAQYLALEKTLNKWQVVVSGGHRITGLADNPSGGAPIGVLLSLVDHFIAINMTVNFTPAVYETALSLLNRVYFHQVEKKMKVAWDPSHLIEKVIQIAATLARVDCVALESPQGVRLLKSYITLLRLLLRNPTVLPSVVDRTRFVYEIIRCKVVIAGLEGFIKKAVEDGKSTIKTVSSSNLSLAAQFLREILEMTETVESKVVELACTDRESVLNAIHEFLELEETNSSHASLWSLPKTLYTSLASAERSLSHNLSDLRNILAEGANDRF